MISINNLSFKYPSSNFTLKDITFSLNKGEKLCIVGGNGSGKSTLLKLIGGLLFSKYGEIKVDNLVIGKKTPNLDIRTKLGMVFQNPDNQILFDNMLDDINFTLNKLKLVKTKEEIENMLLKVGLKADLKANPKDMSMGQKQKFMIASMLLTNSKVLLLDEPTAMLDPVGKNDVMQLLLNLDSTVIYTTNILEEMTFADKVIILSAGKLQKILNKDEILDNLDLFDNVPLKLNLLKQLDLPINATNQEILQKAGKL